MVLKGTLSAVPGRSVPAFILEERPLAAEALPCHYLKAAALEGADAEVGGAKAARVDVAPLFAKSVVDGLGETRVVRRPVRVCGEHLAHVAAQRDGAHIVGSDWCLSALSKGPDGLADVFFLDDARRHGVEDHEIAVEA